MVDVLQQQQQSKTTNLSYIVVVNCDVISLYFSWCFQYKMNPNSQNFNELDSQNTEIQFVNCIKILFCWRMHIIGSYFFQLDIRNLGTAYISAEDIHKFLKNWGASRKVMFF